MKDSVDLIKIVNDIKLMSQQMGGVFSTSDLSSIIAGGSDLKNARAMGQLVKRKVLFRVRRGIYVTADCDLWILAQRLSPKSYISMDTVLARAGFVGTTPSGTVSAVHSGRPDVIRAPNGVIRFHSMQADLFFGIEKNSSGVRVADPEKSFIDLLYYYSKGVRFVIDPVSEVRIGRLDTDKINSYLKKYRNKKFISFVRRLQGEK